MPRRPSSEQPQRSSPINGPGYPARSYPTQTPEFPASACSILEWAATQRYLMETPGHLLPQGPFYSTPPATPVCPLPHCRKASLPGCGSLVALPGQMLPHPFQKAFSFRCPAVAGAEHNWVQIPGQLLPSWVPGQGTCDSALGF